MIFFTFVPRWYVEMDPFLLWLSFAGAIFVHWFDLKSCFIKGDTPSDIKKKELIGLNPELFHNNDSFEFIGKINLSSNRFIDIYFNEHLFGNKRAAYRLISFENDNSISCYRIEDKPILRNDILLFPYKKELGNEIKIKDGIPDNVYLNGELIQLQRIK